MDITIFHSYWTLLLFLLFVGIIIWAWSSKRKPGFDELAKLPLEEEEFVEKTTKSEGQDNA